MDQALIQVGLPVKCSWGDCETRGNVKPKFVDPTHGGWYKSKLFRKRHNLKWYCPEHHEEGRAFDNRFYENYKTPEPYTDAELASFEDTQDELYKLLD